MFWIFFTDSFLFLTFYRFLNRGNLLNVLCLINVELRFGLCSIGSLLLDVIDLLSAWRNNFRISWENNSRNLTGPKLRQLYTFFVCFYEEFNPVLRKGFYLFIYFCTGFCPTLKWNSHGFTCVPHPDPPSHLALHPIPLGFPSAPGTSACLMHPTLAGDLFHPW